MGRRGVDGGDPSGVAAQRRDVQPVAVHRHVDQFPAGVAHGGDGCPVAGVLHGHRAGLQDRERELHAVGGTRGDHHLVGGAVQPPGAGEVAGDLLAQLPETGGVGVVGRRVVERDIAPGASPGRMRPGVAPRRTGAQPDRRRPPVAGRGAVLPTVCRHFP